MSSSSSGAERADCADSFSTTSSGWKQEANHRLAAHRARRGGAGDRQNSLPGMEESAGFSMNPAGDSAKSRSIADRVAARYEKAPTYSEMLAAEARNAARAAEAAVAAANQAREAAQAILVGLDARMHEDDLGGNAVVVSRKSATLETQIPQKSLHLAEVQVSQSQVHPASNEEEPSHPVQALPAKLLEFPRELIAARKARPRLAEGPLREESESLQPQLRIFEVEPETISIEPIGNQVVSGWSSIRLDAQIVTHEDNGETSAGRNFPAGLQYPGVAPISASAFELPLQTASLEDRSMAGLVDLALTTAGFLLFTFIFVASVSAVPAARALLLGAAIAFPATAVLYQLLFFCLGHDTPGMRYAKIALCTFDDGNPTRQAMRRRLLALCLSISPLGLGVIWAVFDHDRLGWHDRISGTYQRSYR